MAKASKRSRPSRPTSPPVALAPRQLNSLVTSVPLTAFGLVVFIRGLQTSEPLAVLIGSIVLAVFVMLVLLIPVGMRQEHRRQLDTGWLTEFPVTYRAGTIGTSVERTRGERRATVGAGETDFDRVSAAVLRWEVKTRAGFQVIRVGAAGSFFSDAPVVEDECAVIRFGPLRETVRVVRVVSKPRLRGFAYGTLPEHPLIGEEAFLVEWRDDGRVDLVIRSFSRPNGILWILLWPVIAIARQVFLKRYLRVLLD